VSPVPVPGRLIVQVKLLSVRGGSSGTSCGMQSGRARRGTEWSGTIYGTVVFGPSAGTCAATLRKTHRGGR